MTLEFVLVDEGFDVLMAHDGEQALALARQHLPDIILLDQVMPKMDGMQVFAQLRADERTSSIPVFVLSGMSRTSSDDWDGAHFVGKPFSPDELVKRIGAALEPPL